MNGAMEIRAVPELRVSGPGKLEGYASVFNAVSQDLGGFTESVKPGAFSRSLTNSENILALYDHDRKSVLGRVGAGTLKLEEDTRGLHFQIDLPDTTAAKDLSILVSRGDVRGASFAFTVPKGGDSWSELNQVAHRSLEQVDLHEITVTASPAYLDTEVAKRTIPLLHTGYKLNLAKRYMETVL